MRIVGTQQRCEIELDPVKAYQRARALDAILRSVRPPIVRGVTRGTHEYFNRLDAERRNEAARAQCGMSTQDPLLNLLARFRDAGVEYVLIGGWLTIC